MSAHPVPPTWSRRLLIALSVAALLVLALPLIAVLAMVMFFSFGQSGPEQAQAASQGSAVAMELRVPANAQVGTKFVVEVWANLTPADPILGFGAQINVDPGLKYNGSEDCLAEVKPRPADNTLALCGSFSPAVTGGQAWSVVTDFVPPRDALVLPLSGKGQLLSVDYSCNFIGSYKIELNVPPANPDGASFGLTTGSIVAVKVSGGLADTESITCTPQAGQININVVDSNVQSLKLGGSCFLVSAPGFGHPLSPPVYKEIDTVSDNNAKASCDPAAPKSDLSDSNPAVGQIEINISGKNRFIFGDTWHIQQTQTQPKYNLDNTKYVCTFIPGQKKVGQPNKTACDEANPFVVKNVLKQGVLNVTFTENISVPGSKTKITGKELCVTIYSDPPTNVVLFKKACTLTGNIAQNLALGSYTVELKDTKLAASSLQLAAGASATLNCDLASSPQTDRTCTVKFSFEGQKVFHLKTPSLSNLFLTNQQGQAKPGTPPAEVPNTIAPVACRAGTDVALFTNNLSLEPASISPKGDPQSVAAFEMEVRYDPKWVCVNIVPGDYWFLQANKTNPFGSGNVRAAAQAIADSSDPVAGGGSPISLKDGSSNVVCFIDDKNDGQQPTGLARIGCVFTGKTLKDIDQTLPLAYVLVKPQPEVYNQIIPNQENGIVTMILNAGCNLADDQGHPIDSSGCDDAALTIRWLEADFNGDCIVDVLDTQAVSMRWGAKAGSLLYSARMDTMPYGNIQGDQRINIKDVQFAYGRVGSECSEQNRFKVNGVPHPDQDPVPNK